MPSLNIAHRGGARLNPENTRAAFADALRRGADGAELDVQLSRDAVAVVHHDFRLNPGYARGADGRWLDGPGPRIKDLRFDELQAFDVGRPAPGSAYAAAHPLLTPVDGAGIPSLADIVALVRAAPFLLLVELKSDTSADSADPVLLADAALRVCAGALDRIVFVGFDWRALARVKQADAAAKIWCTSGEKVTGSAALFDIIKGLGAEGWFAHAAGLTPQAAALARGYGLKLAAWTVNEETEMRRLTALGVDAICTDRPDLLQALEQGG